jgi:hypothetical protein
MIHCLPYVVNAIRKAFLFMGELFDLILDFERKLVLLIRDLIVSPARIGESIIRKDKKYLGAFKFYSFITSIWILFFQFGNQYFDFFSDSFVLPDRLASFLRSEEDFAFLIAPFVVLIEFFLPFAILNYFLFRKKKLSVLQHITLNTYLGAILLLYALPVFLALWLLATYGGIDLTFPFLVLVPLLYYGYVHVRIFDGKKVFSFVKSVLTLAVISYVSVSLFLMRPFHELLHRKILYSKFSRFELKGDAPPGLYTYDYRDSVFFDEDDMNIFMNEGPNNKCRDRHAFIKSYFHKNNFQYSYTLLTKNRFDSLSVVLEKDVPVLLFFNIHQVDPATICIVQNRHPYLYRDTTQLYMIKNNGNTIVRKSYTDQLCLRSRIIRADSTLLFTGIQVKTNLPVIGELNEADGSIVSFQTLENKAGFVIDDIETGSDNSLNIILSSTVGKKLKEVQWVKGEFSAGRFYQQAELSIYKNYFNPTENFHLDFLHKGRVEVVNDSTVIAAFQVMTDSSFATNVTKINTRGRSIIWNSIVTAPGDISYYDHIMVDSTSIYILGRMASVFNKSFSADYHQLPYLQKVDIEDGQPAQAISFALNEDSRSYILEYIESIYNRRSTAYQDRDNIYWDVDGDHHYTIRKAVLANR